MSLYKDFNMDAMNECKNYKNMLNAVGNEIGSI